jgi:ribosome-associated translation inhibitor RaiA
MNVQVNSGHDVHCSEEYIKEIENTVLGSLERFRNALTRVEVFFGDENGTKTGANDKRCTVTAKMSHHDTLAATGHGDVFDAALDSALDKIVRVIESKIGRSIDRTSAVEMINEEQV